MAAPQPPRPLTASDDPSIATFAVELTAWADLLPALAAQWLAALERLPRLPGTQIGGRALVDRLWDGEASAPLGEVDDRTVVWVESDLHGYEVACTPALTAVVVADVAWYKESELLGYRALLAGQAGCKHFYVIG